MIPFFPYPSMRAVQQEFITQTIHALKTAEHAIIHAPTGVGKTAASLAPMLEYAIDNKKVVFFLTSRHTQHIMAINTLRAIQKHTGKRFGVIDLIAKQKMCPRQEAAVLSSAEFSHFCHDVREERSCTFYCNTKTKESVLTSVGEELSGTLKHTIHDTEQLMELSKEFHCCPYELASAAAEDAVVVVADYYYIFHPAIQAPFFARMRRELSDAVIIVDEAHNLPKRIKDLATSKLTARQLRYAVSEADKEGLTDALEILQDLLAAFEKFVDDGEVDQVVDKEFFEVMVDEIGKYDDIQRMLQLYGEQVLKRKRRSYILNVASFMEAWQDDSSGYARILTLDMRDQPTITLAHRCLDPSIVAKPIIEQCHSVVLMSGTLMPTRMYGDLLGFDPEQTSYLELENPFPQENALHLIVPETTTRFQHRNRAQFSRIASYIDEIAKRVPGPMAVFFPSYQLRDAVMAFLPKDRPRFVEKQGFTKAEREALIESFKAARDENGILLGVTSGSFGEGIDLPGDYLRGVIIVGLPLARPDAETGELIRYYESKFGRGWDYGYIFPAFNMTLQNAGRCIRSESDSGIIVYLDERYAWRQYARCFPRDTNIRVESNLAIIDAFFDER